MNRIDRVAALVALCVALGAWWGGCAPEAGWGAEMDLLGVAKDGDAAWMSPEAVGVEAPLEINPSGVLLRLPAASRAQDGYIRWQDWLWFAGKVDGDAQHNSLGEYLPMTGWPYLAVWDGATSRSLWRSNVVAWPNAYMWLADSTHEPRLRLYRGQGWSGTALPQDGDRLAQVWFDGHTVSGGNVAGDANYASVEGGITSRAAGAHSGWLELRTASGGTTWTAVRVKGSGYAPGVGAVLPIEVMASPTPLVALRGNVTVNGTPVAGVPTPQPTTTPRPTVTPQPTPSPQPTATPQTIPTPWPVATVVGDPGDDDTLVTEKAVRDAVNAVEGGSGAATSDELGDFEFDPEAVGWGSIFVFDEEGVGGANPFKWRAVGLGDALAWLGSDGWGQAGGELGDVLTWTEYGIRWAVPTGGGEPEPTCTPAPTATPQPTPTPQTHVDFSTTASVALVAVDWPGYVPPTPQPVPSPTQIAQWDAAYHFSLTPTPTPPSGGGLPDAVTWDEGKRSLEVDGNMDVAGAVWVTTMSVGGDTNQTRGILFLPLKDASGTRVLDFSKVGLTISATNRYYFYMWGGHSWDAAGNLTIPALYTYRYRPANAANANLIAAGQTRTAGTLAEFQKFSGSWTTVASVGMFGEVNCTSATLLQGIRSELGGHFDGQVFYDYSEGDAKMDIRTFDSARSWDDLEDMTVRTYRFRMVNPTFGQWLDPSGHVVATTETLAVLHDADAARDLAHVQGLFAASPFKRDALEQAHYVKEVSRLEKQISARAALVKAGYRLDDRVRLDAAEKVERLGFVAEELAAVDARLVAPDGRGVSATAIAAHNTAALKEAKRRIEALEAQVAAQQAALEALAARVASLEGGAVRK